MATSSSPSRAEMSADERIPSSYPALGECSASAPPATPCSKLPRQASSIAREASIYSLTLDDLQNTLDESGKPLGSMNMDEFLRNIWTAEESQAMAVAAGSVDDEGSPDSWQEGAHRQGAISLSRTVSRKAVEDLWRDIAGAGGIETGFCAGSTLPVGAGQERQNTIAEMTLEDFLAKVGVVMKDGSGDKMQSVASFGSSLDNGDGAGERSSQNGALFGYQGAAEEKPNIYALPALSFCASEPSPSQEGEGPGLMQTQALKNIWPLPRAVDFGMLTPLSIKAGSPTSPFSNGVDLGNESMCARSPLPYNVDESMCAGRKRGFECSLEKVVARRHKRMIKNRESAARSRARKQQYTVELEADVLQLRNENMRLRHLQKKMEGMQRKQVSNVAGRSGCLYLHSVVAD